MLSRPGSRPCSRHSQSAPQLPRKSVAQSTPPGSANGSRRGQEGHATMLPEIAKGPQPPVDLKMDQIAQCTEAANKQAKKLPNSMAELRMFRNRMPTCPLTQKMRNGAGIEEVAEDAALRLVETWARMLTAMGVPADQLAPTIALLVHGADGYGQPSPGMPPLTPIELPASVMTVGLLRLVPTVDALASGEPWKFFDEIFDVWQLEEQFDRSSWIHSPSKASKLRVACNRDPLVWKQRPDYIEDMSRIRGQLSSTDRFRVTTALVKSYPDQWRKRQKPPGVAPGHYGARDPRDWYTMPLQGGPFARRAEFPSAGRSRGVCTVTPLDFLERGLKLAKE